MFYKYFSETFNLVFKKIFHSCLWKLILVLKSRSMLHFYTETNEDLNANILTCQTYEKCFVLQRKTALHDSNGSEASMCF